MNRIMVIDDDLVIRKVVAEVLVKNGYEAIVASSAIDALNMLNVAEPDLIISDIEMPKMNGYELLSVLQQNVNFCNIPFLFLSSKAQLADIREGMSIGADDYLTKPFKVQDLILAIKARLSRYRNIKTAIKNDIISNTMSMTERNELKEKLKLISKSELRVLEKLALNFNSAQISKELYLSLKTVQNHRANMVKKLEFSGQNALLSFAISCKLLELFSEQGNS